MIFGKDEIHIHHYVLKLFPFCLGGDAKKWYNFLNPNSISSKDEYRITFYTKYFPADKALAMIADISNFT
jgi:hypothetical protein